MTGVDSKLYISFTLFNYITVYNYLPSEKVKLTLIIQLKDSLRRIFFCKCCTFIFLSLIDIPCIYFCKIQNLIQRTPRSLQQRTKVNCLFCILLFCWIVVMNSECSLRNISLVLYFCSPFV
jgi:F0F1-type ATP synthase membrane subunit a